MHKYRTKEISQRLVDIAAAYAYNISINKTAIELENL